jgi:hypothetical protein
MTLIYIMIVLSVLDLPALYYVMVKWVELENKRDIVPWNRVRRMRYLGIAHIVLSLAFWGLTIHLWSKSL